MSRGRTIACSSAWVLAAAALAAGAHAQVPTVASSASASAAPSASAPPAATSPPAAATTTLTTQTALPPFDPAGPDPATVVNTRPFGPGFPVSISCSRPFAYGFVAKGALDSRPSYPDPFIKVGRLPLTIELPSGVYTVVIEGETVTTGSTVFEVRNAPTQILVRGGSSALRELSTWLMAFGGAALLAAGVLELSRSGSDENTQKHTISIPLAIGGGVSLLSGLTMVFVSSTSFQTDAFVPGKSSSPAAQWNPGLLFYGRF